MNQGKYELRITLDSRTTFSLVFSNNSLVSNIHPLDALKCTQSDLESKINELSEKFKSFTSLSISHTNGTFNAADLCLIFHAVSGKKFRISLTNIEIDETLLDIMSSFASKGMKFTAMNLSFPQKAEYEILAARK